MRERGKSKRESGKDKRKVWYLELKGRETGLTNPNPSKTASTKPAANAEQLRELISRETEINFVIAGSFSINMTVGYVNVMTLSPSAYSLTRTHIRHPSPYSSECHPPAFQTPLSKSGLQALTEPAGT
jgi:hypothetical protein